MLNRESVRLSLYDNFIYNVCSYSIKYHFVLLLCLVACSNVLLGQNQDDDSRIDSLTILLSSTEATSEKLQILIDLVGDSSYSGHKSFNVFYTQLVDLAQKSNDNYSLAVAEQLFAGHLFRQNKLSEARDYYQRSSDLFKSVNALNDAYIALCHVGVQLYRQGKFIQAEKIFDEVLSNTTVDSLKESRAQAYLNKGSSNLRRHVLDTAEISYTKAKELFKELKDTSKIIPCMNNLGIIYYQTNRTNKSLAAFEQVKDFHKALGNDYKLSSVLSNLAELYLGLTELDKALAYAKDAYYLSIDINAKKLQGDNLNLIGRIYRKNGENESALKFLDKAIELNEENIFGEIMCIELKGEILRDMKYYDEAITTYQEGLSKVSIKIDGGAKLQFKIPLAEVYYAKGDIEQAKNILSTINDDSFDQHYLDLLNYLKSKISKDENKIDLAIKHGESAFENMLNSEKIGHSYELAGILSKAYEEKKSFAKALFYSNQQKRLGDSLHNVDKVKALTKESKDFEFELERRDLAAAQAQKEAILKTETKQSRIIAGSIGAIALLLSFFFCRNNKQKKLISEKNNQLASLNTTKDQIFSIIGHDLRKPAVAFNNISESINYLIQNEDYDTLKQMGTEIERDGFALQKLTDNLLNWALSQRDVLPYKPSSFNLRAKTEEVFSSFHRAANEKGLILTNEVSVGTTIYADPNATFTILMNLIDNAIKFTSRGGQVTVESSQVDGKVQLLISDTGVGMQQDQLVDMFVLSQGKSHKGTEGEKGTGLGLHLVNELVKMNKGEIQGESQLGTGTTFRVRLPMAG